MWQPGVTELLTLDSALCQRLRRIALQPQATTTEMCVRVGSPGDHLVLGSLLHVEYFHGARLPQVPSPVNLGPRACGSCARQSTHMTVLCFTGLLQSLPCNDMEQSPCACPWPSVQRHFAPGGIAKAHAHRYSSEQIDFGMCLTNKPDPQYRKCSVLPVHQWSMLMPLTCRGLDHARITGARRCTAASNGLSNPGPWELPWSTGTSWRTCPNWPVPSRWGLPSARWMSCRWLRWTSPRSSPPEPPAAGPTHS